MAKSAAKVKRQKLEDDFETKPVSKKHKEKSEEITKEFADSLQQQIKRRIDLLETKSHQANKEETVEEPPDFVEEVAPRKRKLFIDHLSRQTNLSDIINFFNDVGEVVRVQINVKRNGVHAGSGFAEFASANDAKKALEKKNGEYLCGQKVYLSFAKINPPPRCCIDHKVVWYEDYLRRESLLIEEDETVEGDDEDPNSFEVVAIRKKTLFIANLSPQSGIIDVCKFFQNVGQIVSIRVIVNDEGKHVGCGFVEFVSANEAKEALEKKGDYLHDHKIFLDVTKIAPYPPRPKCEDYLQRESLLIEEDETMEGLDEDPDFVKQEVAARKKTLFVGHLSSHTEIIDICKFFHSVGEVVHARLIVDHKGEHAGYAFVEFASASEAEKALEKKNGKILHDRKIILDVAKGAKYRPPKYCMDHKVWYEDYLRRESSLIEDDTVEGLVEEVAARKKTLFVSNLPPQSEYSDFSKFFNQTGKVVSRRVIVNDEGKHVGCGFIEFASSIEAKKALKKKKGKYLQNRKIFLDVTKRAPYPPRPKYNLAEKLWNEEYLQRESLVIEEDLETKPILKFHGTKISFTDDEEAF